MSRPIPPLPMIWTGDGLTVARGFAKIADQHYVIGETYVSAPVEERSEASHRHEFAWLREAWASLPEHLAAEYPSSEHLRKRGLIATGFCTMQDYVCGSAAEAARWERNLRRELDEYAVVVVSASTVRVFRARSQSRKAMPPAEFQASKTALLDWVAALLDVAPEVLSSQGSGGAKNPARVAA